MIGFDAFHDRLLQACADGALLLTANRRLARHLRRLYDDRMLSRGFSAWPAPDIHHAEAWLGRALDRVEDGWRFLPPRAAQMLWEEVIESADGSAAWLLQVPASARKARDAHELLVEYRADLTGHPLTEDHRAFLQWRCDYLARCAEGGWLDPADRSDRISAAIAGSALPLPGRLLLVGYDELPPAFRRLADAASVVGCRVEEVPAPSQSNGNTQRLACRDVADEVRHAARWARSLLEAGESRIGIVVPQLSAFQPLIERIFREELDPPSLLACSDEEFRFNLSLGAPLSQQGAILAALELLGVGLNPNLETVSFLLRSPYLAGGEREAESRARFERNLRALRCETIPLRSLARQAQSGAGGGGSRGSRSPTMADIFQSLDEWARDRERHLPGVWRTRIVSLLARLGWPGERQLDSRDFQVVKAWREKLLPQFSALDSVSRPLTRSEAVALLRRLAGEIEFQPDVPDAVIQVCGVLEAGGLCFDHLWLLGFHEGAWPPTSAPNPFIPPTLQSRCGMPHADPFRETDFARRVMARLLAAAPYVIASHPLLDGDCALRPSPVIALLPPAELPLPPSCAPARLQQAAAVTIETLPDEHGPPLAVGELALGGTSILKDQALCPFRAFARHRLHASALDLPSPGIDPATRGSLVHSVLERFWEATGCQAELLTMTSEKRRERVAACVEAAVDECFARRGLRPPEALLAIERHRLETLIEEWLQEVELKRTSFASVEREQEHEESFGGLRFRTKLDRIDAAPDGRRVVIDYKTGRVDLADLLGDRLLEPQLPVYAIGEGGGDLAGVAIALVRRSECTLKGVARDGDLLPGIEAFDGSRTAGKYALATWEVLLARWQAQLEDLGSSFTSGTAAVDPVSEQKACRTCDLAALCRVAEAGIPSSGSEEEG